MARQAAGLVRDLGSASAAKQLEAATELGELAAAPGGAQRIQRAGGVPALVRALQGECEELQVAAASALTTMMAHGRGTTKEVIVAGAGRAVAQRLPSSRSPAAALALMCLLGVLLASDWDQPVIDELAASPSCLERLAQLAADPSQDASTHFMAVGLLAGQVLATVPSAVAAAAAPHAAGLVQRLSTRAERLSDPWMQQEGAARLVELLAAESAELAASMVAAGALPPLVELAASASPQSVQKAALAALIQLLFTQPSVTGQLAAVDGFAEQLVQLLASTLPPASCKQAWDEEKAYISRVGTMLLGEISKVDASLACRAIAAGALQQLTLVLRWGANRLERQARKGQREEATDTSCMASCGGLFFLMYCGSGPGAVTPAVQAELVQLVQLVLQHCWSYNALCFASQLLVLLRDPDSGPQPNVKPASAEVLRQLQPGGQPGRAAAIAVLLSELTGEAQQAGGGSGAATAPAGPSSSGAAAQERGQIEGAVAAECAACNALPPAGRKFQVCAGCRAVRYCSPACQKAAWRSGHKAACRASGREQGGKA
jgi:hypothetical protein